MFYNSLYRYQLTGLALLLFLLTACSDNEMTFNIPVAPREVPLLEVYSPNNGAVLTANEAFILDYEVVRGDGGAYVVIQIDQQKPIIVYRTYGRHHIDPLPAGKHTINILEYTREGKATGAQAILHLTMR